jgi:hypothetical protein
MHGFIRYLKQVNFLMGENSKKVIWLFFLFLLSSVLDIIGLSIIGPY